MRMYQGFTQAPLRFFLTFKRVTSLPIFLLSRSLKGFFCFPMRPYLATGALCFVRHKPFLFCRDLRGIPHCHFDIVYTIYALR